MKNSKVQTAFELYNQGLKLKEIAEKLDVPAGTVRRWKCVNKWDEKSERSEKKKANVRGAPKGNKNAVGNSGGTPVKHGLFSRCLPDDESREMFDELESMDKLDILWHNIKLQEVAILRSQKIMYVKDRDDKTESQVGFASGKVESETWEVQQAWDKQGNYLKALSRAQAELRNMIKDYLELEGKSKADATEAAKDWKSAVIEIAKRRAEHNE